MLCNLITVRCFCLMLIFDTIQAITKTPSGNAIKIKCRASNGTEEKSDGIYTECCNEVVKQYYKKWSLRFYLSSFLEILQRLNCPQFKQECERRTFNYSNFTSLMYSRFCNRSQMEEQCYDDIANIAAKQNSRIQTTASTFDELVSKLNLSVLSEQDLIKPCVQIAMYNTDAGDHGQYFEVISLRVPFCGPVWCGFNRNITLFKHIAVWNCMPTRCRANVVVFMVVISILAVSTFLCNAIILIVTFFSKKLQNVQGIYRLSLAVADILVGLIVFPTFISTLYGHFNEHYDVNVITNNSKYSTTNYSAMQFEIIKIEGQLHIFRSSSRKYFNAVGFFTVLSLFVSVYSLVAASFDRFMAIHRPLKYNELKSIFAAKIATITIWFSGIVFGILPLFIFSLRYQLVASIMISSSGPTALVLYGIVLFIPLVMMWVLIIATFVAARSTISRNHDKQKQINEQMQLARTLGIMIGIFTFSLLPAIVIILLPHFLSNINLNRPLDLDIYAANLFTSLEMVAVIILTSNSLWNCFIYSARDKKFRYAFKQLFVRFVSMFEIDAWKDFRSKRASSVKPF